ncbi:hypothetical protein DBA29_16370 [Xenophilus aerolatus]|nr:hypothetical protein [Xenophilus aerolatus]
MTHNNNFDAIRLIAALTVLISHQFPLTGRTEPMALDPYRFGTVGVVAFFSISGYLVMTSWARDPRIVAFAVKRLLRLWPGLAVVTLVLTVLAICFQPHRWSEAMEFLRMNLVFVQRGGNYFQANPIAILNGPTWTIPIEAFCYFALVIAALMFRRALPLALIAFVVLVGNYARSVSDASLIEKAQAMGHPTFAPWLIAIFMFGALLSLWPRLQRPWPIFVAIGLAALWAGHSSLALLIAAPPLLIWVGQRSWPIFQQAGRFGDFSYGIYLWAWPVQQSVVALIGKDAPIAAHLFLSISITVALAAISWHMVEKIALMQKDQVRRPPESQRG